MTVEDTAKELWGGETRKAVDNFPVSGERVPVAVVRWLGRIKGAAARANADLGLLDADLANRIAAAGDEIAEGAHDEADDAIVRSTIELAHNLGLQAVAEGVESAAIWLRLAALGCDLAQGFHLSPPLQADALLALLDAERGVPAVA